jgi:hypothetical protein
MCYDASARPPLPPVAGGAGIGRSGGLVPQPADGNRFGAHSATTAAPGGPGIVILPDVRGLHPFYHPFYKELAERFAEAGVHATAMDHFGRTAGRATIEQFRGALDATASPTSWSSTRERPIRSSTGSSRSIERLPTTPAAGSWTSSGGPPHDGDSPCSEQPALRDCYSRRGGREWDSCSERTSST